MKKAYKISDSQALALVKLNEDRNNNIFVYIPKIDVIDLEENGYIYCNKDGEYLVTDEGKIYIVAYLHGFYTEIRVEEELKTITKEQINLLIDVCRRGREVKSSKSNDILVDEKLLTVNKKSSWLGIYEATEKGKIFTEGYVRGTIEREQL